MKKNLAAALIFLLTSCGLFEFPNQVGDNGKVPSNMNPVSFLDLPGWQEDDQRYALQAFRNTCKTNVQFTAEVVPDPQLLAEKCKFMPSEYADLATVRKWFEDHFQPFLIDDGTDGKFTGYYSPIIRACRTQTPECSVPVMDKPIDGTNYKGLDSKTIVRNRIGKVIYWIDPIDLQDMGSATLILDDGSKVKLSVASTNDLPFNGIGSQLLARGIRPPEGYGMKSVRKYLKNNRELAAELIANNPRYVYYTESSTDSVVGTMGVPLTKIRSIAVDKNIYTLGLPMYVDTKLSIGKSFRRLMVAQDTGGAIKGYARADIYFGVGDEAFEYAHGQNEKGRMFVLMPKEYGK